MGALIPWNLRDATTWTDSRGVPVDRNVQFLQITRRIGRSSGKRECCICPDFETDVLGLSTKDSPDLPWFGTVDGFSSDLQILVPSTEPRNETIAQDVSSLVEWNPLVLLVKFQRKGLPRFLCHGFYVTEKPLGIVFPRQFVSHPLLL